MTPKVLFENVSVTFGEHTVLRDINVSFPSLGISVLVGRSGSGKTTLLRCVNRLNEEFSGCRTSGQVYADLGPDFGPVRKDNANHARRSLQSGGTAGDKADYKGNVDHNNAGQSSAANFEPQLLPLYNNPQLNLSALRLRAGMLFQTPNLFPVSVYRNLSMPLELAAGFSKSELPDRIKQALEAVGLWPELENRLDLPAERLSGGQQQRLCLARTLALEPQILLLDEPTASLDVYAARDIEDLLLELANRYPIIMVSHSLTQARRLGSRILVCEAGSISATLSAAEAISDELLARLL